MNNILVLAPHGDDEVLGCGGAICKHLETGDQVTVAFIKAPYDKRSEIQLLNTDSSKNVLGYNKKVVLNLDIDDFFNKTLFITKLEELIINEKPDYIYSTFCSDLHQDHRALFEALNSSCRTWGPHKVKKILLYETISSTNQGFYSHFHPFSPNYYVVLNQTHVDRKINAMKCYSEEIKDSSHLRSQENILHHLEARGREVMEKYAEAFYLIRSIEN
jgi:LmbE family N-acetylglucosaminyl deacetylase